MLKKHEKKKHFKNNYSTEDMRNTIKNMSNIFNLLKSNENYDKISSKKILLMSNQIKNKIRKNFKIEKLDENDFSYLKNKSKKNSLKNENKSLNEIEIKENEFNLIDKKNFSNDEIKKINKNIKKFKQKEKIMKLKYEILIKDLKKKYNFNKTFEEKIQYKSFHFLREKNNKNNQTKLIKNNKNNFLNSNNNKNNFLFNFNRFSHKNFHKKNNNFNNNNNNNFNNNFNNFNNNFNSFSSDFNNLNSQISTSSNENNFLTPNFSRNKKLIKNFSSNNSIINNNNNKKLTNSIKIFNKINNIQKIILTESENFKHEIKEKNKKIIKKKPKKQNFNKKIDEINKEFGFENYNKKNLNYKEINEDEIVYKNQKNVEIKLDPNCKKILNEVVKKLKFDDFRFNRKFIDESLYEKKIFKIKQNSEMNNLAKFTTHLEKKLKNKFFKFSNNETEENKINKNINKIIDNKRIDSEENINDIILRHNILKKIKPSLKLTRTYKRIYSEEDYQLLYKEKVEKERRKEKYKK